MATYRKRGKNWEYRIRYTDPLTGKKHEKTAGGFRTKPEAEYAASQAFLDVKDGMIAKNNNILLRDFIDLWWNNYKGSVKETSLRSRKVQVNNIKKWFKQLKLIKLNHNIYQKILNEKKADYSRNYLVSINQVMQMIAKQAVKEGYFRSNPISDVKVPHYEEQEKIKYWELVDIKKFQDYCIEDATKKRRKGNEYLNLEKKRELALYYLMLYGGLRVGEACALQTTDYYVLTHEVNISKTLGSSLSNQTKDSYRVYPPKTKNAYRTIPLPEIAYKQLEKWLRLRSDYQSISKTFHESHYIFCKKDGSPLTPRDVQTKFRVIVEKLDLPKISPHGLRHTYTALQIQAGTDLKSLQMLLGHADSKTTLNIYAHLTKDKKRENIDRFNKMLQNLDGGAKAGQALNQANAEPAKPLDTKRYLR